MTTVVFYKGVMAADSLQTECMKRITIDTLIPGDLKFKLVTKIEHITVNSKAHLIGLSGDVPTIVDFLDAYRKNELSKFKPKGAFRVMDWDREKLVVWYASESMKPMNILLNLIPWVSRPEWKSKLRSKVYDYDQSEETAYVIGSGSDFCQAAYSNLRFQFQLLGEKIEDHLKPIEVVKYLVKVASLCDYHTNDKVCWSTAKADIFTPVSPQNANLSKG